MIPDYRGYHFAEIFAPLKRAPESVQKRIKEIPQIVAPRTILNL